MRTLIRGNSMSAVLVSHDNDKAIFTVEIPYETFEEAIQKAYLRNRGSINIPGFRKGKAPRKIIEANYGQEIFYDDAINYCLPEAYDVAVDDLKLDPIDQPSVDVDEIEKDKPLQVKFEVETRPIPVLGDYKNIELVKMDFSVSDEDVEREVEKAREANSRMVTIEDRAVENGDMLTIDFAGTVNGEAFEGGTSEDYNIEVGSNTFIPGFEDQLVGKNAQENFDVHVTFPEDYHQEELAGAPAVFNVTIKGIKRKELPALDDEFAKDISEFDTLDEYKNDLRANLQKKMDDREKADTENRAVHKLIEISEVNAPKVMVEHQINNEMKDFERQLSQMGLTLDTYMQYTGSTVEQAREQFQESSESRVKGDLVIDALVAAENIEASDEDVDNELKEIAEQYSPKNQEKFIEDIRSGDITFIVDTIKRRKALQLLVEGVRFVEMSEDAEEETPNHSEDQA